MTTIKQISLAIIAILGGNYSVEAQTSILKLWPDTPPGPAAKVVGEERDLTTPEDKLIAGRKIIKLGHVGIPQMHVYLPPKEKAVGGAVLVCPGGGFSILAWDLEGTEIAEWLNSLGLAAIVVKYRVPTREQGDDLNEAGNAPLKAVGPVMDAQRAMSLTRSKATEWNLDPNALESWVFRPAAKRQSHRDPR